MVEGVGLVVINKLLVRGWGGKIFQIPRGIRETYLIDLPLEAAISDMQSQCGRHLFRCFTLGNQTPIDVEFCLPVLENASDMHVATDRQLRLISLHRQAVISCVRTECPTLIDQQASQRKRIGNVGVAARSLLRCHAGFDRKLLRIPRLFKREHRALTVFAVEVQRIVCPRFGCCQLRCTRISITNTHPLGPHDLAVVVVAGGIFQDVALAFVEVVQGQRVLVGLASGWRRKILRVARRVRHSDFVHAAAEELVVRSQTETPMARRASRRSRPKYRRAFRR